MATDESTSPEDGVPAGCAEPLAQARRRIEKLEQELAKLRESEQQAAELARALRDSEERYRILVDTCPDGITVTDLQGKLLMTNQQTAAIHGYESPEEMVAAAPDAFSLIAPEDRDRAYENARKTLENGRVRSIEYSVLDRQGNRVPVELNVSLITDEHGAPRAFVGVTRDITQRKQAEAERERLQAQVQHAQKLESLGVLAGGIAHDFNNLLVGILGSASLALPTLPPDADMPARHHLTQIETAALRARELTAQLLAYAGKAHLHVEPLDLTALVKEMTDLLTLSVSKNATLRCELAPDLPAVEADATQLRQVVMNLITNASEALGDTPGAITVRTTLTEVDSGADPDAFGAAPPPAGRYVCLEVRDGGCGMDDDVAAKLFEPFFTTKFPGRGLGLSAVLGIIRSHRGSISVDTAPGRGTLVRVLLPASERPPTGPPQPTAEDAPSTTVGGTILAVDDEPAVRAVIEAMLVGAGYGVVLARDGAEALARFRESPDAFAAVLLDTTMPNMDGAAASRELRRIRPDIRIIFSSGFTEEDVAERIELTEVDGFIQKPYRVPTLLALIDRVLRR